jgi:hypothetical protein
MPKYFPSSLSSATVVTLATGTSRRKNTPVRQTIKGTRASVRRKKAGSSATKAEQRFVKIAVLKPT